MRNYHLGYMVVDEFGARWTFTPLYDGDESAYCNAVRLYNTIEVSVIVIALLVHNQFEILMKKDA